MQLRSRRDALGFAGATMVMVLASGCATPGGEPGSSGPLSGLLDGIARRAAEQRRTELAQVTDRTMADAFYELGDDGRAPGVVKPLRDEGYRLDNFARDHVSVRRFSQNQGNMVDASAFMDRYGGPGDADLPARIYAATAKARGNTVRVYKIPMTVEIHRFVRAPMTVGERGRAWLDKDVALIEWNPQGRMVSVMTRAHSAMPALGVVITHLTTVFFGPELMRRLENNLKNSVFAENELLSIAPL